MTFLQLQTSADNSAFRTLLASDVFKAVFNFFVISLLISFSFLPFLCLLQLSYKSLAHILQFSLPPLHCFGVFLPVFIIVFFLAPKYEKPLKISDAVEKHHASISTAGSLVTAEGIPRGYLASAVHAPVPTIQPSQCSVGTQPTAMSQQHVSRANPSGRGML